MGWPLIVIGSGPHLVRNADDLLLSKRSEEARVVLVEEVSDTVPRPSVGVHEPKMTHALTWAAVTAAQFEALLDELAQAGS